MRVWPCGLLLLLFMCGVVGCATLPNVPDGGAGGSSCAVFTPAQDGVQPPYPGYPRMVKQPTGVDVYYPALLERLETGLEAATQPKPLKAVPGTAKVFLAPWGALDAALPVASALYQYLAADPGLHTIVFLARPHQGELHGTSVWHSGGYATPLTVTPVNALPGMRLLKHPQITFAPEAHARESAIETQVLLLQRLLPTVRILPILIGPQSDREIEQVAQILSPIISADGVVLVAVSNLSRGMEDPGMARNVDMSILGALRSVDPVVVDRARRFLDNGAPRGVVALESPNVVFCALEVAKRLELDTMTVLWYGNNWNVPGSPVLTGYAALALSARNRSVVYGSAETDREVLLPHDNEAPLDARAQEDLRGRAREALEAAVVFARYDAPYPSNPSLLKHQPLFVTILDADGQQRGSAGRFDAYAPLYRSVVDLTRAAGTEAGGDPRDPAVALGREGVILLELIREMQPVTSWREVDAREQGVRVMRGVREGVVLPSQAQRHGWNARQMLAEACRVAGLPANAFLQGGCDMFTFTVQRIEDPASP